MLKLTDIHKDYRVADSKVEALRGVSLEFRKSEFVSILGPSGCGKTTMLNIIGGLDKYTRGDLSICGKSTKNFKDVDWDTYRNHRIGFVFQNYNLIPHLSILGNVELSLTLTGISKAERKARATEALIKVGLEKEIGKRPNQLSGGQMQRVAIARALVNNPQILLADEPTGALDSETSVQIMDLIKNIAKERLVIMVTHNGEIAEQYSTRIIRLLDGVIVGDTNPYTSDNATFDDDVQEVTKKEIKKKNRKTSMSFRTAISLSGRNLLSKRNRAIITSIAGSIGIIGVCLVLALSSGFNNYIDSMQKEMLSYYPLEIKENTYDLSAFTETAEADIELDRLNDKIYVDSFLTQLAGGISITNDISENYVNYVEDMDKSLYSSLMYGYGVSYSNNIYTKTSLSFMGGEKMYALSSIYSYYTDMLRGQDEVAGEGEETGLGNLTSMYGAIEQFSSIFNKMPDDKDFILSQYELLEGNYPTKPTDMLLVVSGEQEIYDLTLAQLGYYSETEFFNLFNNDSEKKTEFTYQEILGSEFYYVPNNDAYTNVDQAFNHNSAFANDAMPSSVIEAKITGILKLKDGISQGCLKNGLNYTDAFEQKAFESSKDSTIIQKLNEDDITLQTLKIKYVEYEGRKVPAVSPLGNVVTIANVSDNIRKFGGNDMPNYIALYTKDFDSKDAVCEYLDTWNNKEGNENKQVVYSDTISLVMSFVKTMITAITAVLVAFTSISLVVSSVMIGIITYVSVVERTKEIGVLRAIGARKKDIKNVFNAETAIIGLCSGLIGAGATYLISLVANIILVSVTGIAGLCALPLWQAGTMVFISICLTLISGIIPASAAAKKEPVVALRTE